MALHHFHSAAAGARPLSASGAGAASEMAQQITTSVGHASRSTSCPRGTAMTSEEKLEARRERARAKARKQAEERILTAIRMQGRLEKTNTPDAASGSYFSLPSGRVVSRDVCERLIGSGILKPCQDGLFDDSQTYVVSA